MCGRERETKKLSVFSHDAPKRHHCTNVARSSVMSAWSLSHSTLSLLFQKSRRFRKDVLRFGAPKSAWGGGDKRGAFGGHERKMRLRGKKREQQRERDTFVYKNYERK